MKTLPDEIVVARWTMTRSFGEGWFVREFVTAWDKQHNEQRTQLIRDFAWIKP